MRSDHIAAPAKECNGCRAACERVAQDDTAAARAARAFEDVKERAADAAVAVRRGDGKQVTDRQSAEQRFTEDEPDDVPAGVGDKEER